MSRLPSLPPSRIADDQQAFYQELTQIIQDYFGHNFTTKSSVDDSFLGPFGIFMHTPQLGRPFFALMLALSQLSPSLSPAAREVAILATGSHYKARYELYAHGHVSQRKNLLSAIQIEEICRGVKPGNLDGECGIAYDIATALVSKPGALDSKLYERAEEGLGREGVVALIQFVGFYAYTCLLLNGFDADVPEDGQE